MDVQWTLFFLETYTSAHPSPCCCCSMMTASSALLSPLTRRNCKRLSTLFEYLETMQILTIQDYTLKIYPVQLIPPNLVTQYTWCWCTKNTLVPICTESPRTKCVQLASTCLPRVHPVLLRCALRTPPLKIKGGAGSATGSALIQPGDNQVN